MPQQTFLFKQRGIQFYISLFSLFLSFFKCISFRPPVHQRCMSLPTTSLFTTVQSDRGSWLDAGTKQFFDPAAGGSTHSSPLSEADLTYSPPLPCSWSPPLSEADLTYSPPLPSCSWSPPLPEADLTCSPPLPCSWSPPLSEADLTCSSPLPCSWSPPLSEAGLPYSSPPPAVDRLPFSVGLPRSSTPFLATDLLYLQHNSPQTRQSTDIPCSRSLTQPRQAEK